MKALSIRISAGIIALGALLYFLACSPATQNDNSSQNQGVSPNQNQANGNSASKDLRPCQDYGSDPGGSHGNSIKKKIKDKMSSSLKRLLKDQDNPNGTFTITVQKADNDAKYFVAYVAGKVSGDDNLKELSNILNDFQNREECLRVVYFLPNPTTPSARGDGFEWSSCEHPLVVCPNGECCMPIDANTNTNVNSNSNSNSNANANANR